jgi:death-on-curing family protein
MSRSTVSDPFSTLKFVTAAHILRLHSLYIRPTAVPTQPRLLESATASPLNTLSYGPSHHHTPFYLAANLAEKIMLNHVYQDGNKRTALLAAGLFLRLNGYGMIPRENGCRLEATEDGTGEDLGITMLEDAIVGVVVRRLTVEMLGRYFEGISTSTAKG